MAKIVITSWGSHGDTDPYLALALGLKARGHAPLLALPAAYKDVVEEEGIAFHAVRPTVDVNDPDFTRRVMHPRHGTEMILREILMPAVEESYADLAAAAEGADLLISHPVTFAAPIIAATRRMKWISTVLAPMSFFSAHEAPVMPPAPWLKGVERRVPGMGRQLVRLARTVTRSWSQPVHDLRAKLGLPRDADPIYEGQHAPLVLALFSRVLATPQPDWPANVQVTGQLVHDRAHGTELPTQLEEFLATGDAPIVFTLGTSAVVSPGQFYQESVAAARRIGRRAVLLVGHDGMAEMDNVSSSDVIAVAAAPHSLLFPRAAAVVHQCGIGTLGQALRAGVPMLCVPFAHDQPDNAWRATRLGVARTLSPRRYTAARAAAALDRLLRDRAYAVAAARVAEQVHDEHGVEAACAAVEACLQS